MALIGLHLVSGPIEVLLSATGLTRGLGTGPWFADIFLTGILAGFLNVMARHKRASGQNGKEKDIRKRPVNEVWSEPGGDRFASHWTVCSGKRHQPRGNPAAFAQIQILLAGP